MKQYIKIIDGVDTYHLLVDEIEGLQFHDLESETYLASLSIYMKSGGCITINKIDSYNKLNKLYARVVAALGWTLDD